MSAFPSPSSSSSKSDSIDDVIGGGDGVSNNDILSNTANDTDNGNLEQRSNGNNDNSAAAACNNTIASNTNGATHIDNNSSSSINIDIMNNDKDGESSPQESPKPPKRAKTVSFSQEVLSKDQVGDGKKVVIREEHGIFLGPLLSRLVVSDHNRSNSSSASSLDHDHDHEGGVDHDIGGEGGGGDGTNRNNGGGSRIRWGEGTMDTPVISFDIGTEQQQHSRTNSSSNHFHGGNNGILSNKSSSSSDSKRKSPSSSPTTLEPSSPSLMVEYDNLVVRMGLLKCGHRYRVVVPVPNYWKNKNNHVATATAGADCDAKRDYIDGSIINNDEFQPQQLKETEEEISVRIIEDSFDDDLKGVIEIQEELLEESKEEEGEGDGAGVGEREENEEIMSDDVHTMHNPPLKSTSKPKAKLHPMVNITLSAKRRGPYRGRFVLELTRTTIAASISTGNIAHISTTDYTPTSTQKEEEEEEEEEEAPSSLMEGLTIHNPNPNDANMATNVAQATHRMTAPNKSTQTPTAKSTLSQTCIMSLQVDATIMGKDMGTPKLRNGVFCLGKIVGYDSDEETEWQGFD